jgi:alkylation response protein AidB-like acyl-CoA dehydrogenase
MFEWSDTDLIMRDTVREFIDKEIRPQLDALETGEISPYRITRKLFTEFGLDVLAAEAVKTMLDRERAREAEASEHRSDEGASQSRPSNDEALIAAGESEHEQHASSGPGAVGAQASIAAVLASELAGVSIGLLSTIGVSLGLGAATIMGRGTLAQKDAGCPS